MSSSNGDHSNQNHEGALEEEKKPLKLRSCSNYGLPPIKPPKKKKKKQDSTEVEDDKEEEQYEVDTDEPEYEEEEEISTPFRSSNRKSGKPSSNSISAYTKADKNGKTVKKTSKYLMTTLSAIFFNEIY